MRQMTLTLIMVWISSGLLLGCASSKSQVFGDDMPTMKEIHDDKFSTSDENVPKPQRSINQQDKTTDKQAEFQWLPNPTLSMYVFKHLSSAGHPVPGYNTFFRLYDKEHLAEPGEQGGWEQ